MPRTAIQDMNSSLSLRAAASAVDCGTDFVGTGNITITGWVKMASYGGALRGRIFDNGSCFFYVNNGTAIRNIEIIRDSTIAANSVTDAITVGNWYYISATSTSAGVSNIYVNGVLSGTANQTAGTPTAALTNAFVGNNLAGTRNFDGLMKNLRFYNSILTTTEIRTLMNGGEVAGATRIFNANEGAGTVLYDSSGNGNNGTITSGTYVIDTPTKKRLEVGGNLVYNGDFEYAPPSATNVATTTGSRWLDGTASGSTTNTLFGWLHLIAVGSGSTLFDSTEKYSGNYSIKVTTAAGASVAATNWSSFALNQAFYCQTGVSYTIGGRMKTRYISGDCTTGAQIQVLSRNSAGSIVTTAQTTYVKTTTGWTYYSTTITPAATSVVLTIKCIVEGNSGAGTLAMDAWFDDIELRPTTPVTRTAITGPFRQPVDNMVRNGDFEYAPAFTAATTTRSRFIDGTAGGSATNNIYRWALGGATDAVSAQYDTSIKYSGTASLKVSTTNASGAARAMLLPAPNASAPSAANIVYYIPALPNTSYTLSGWVKTNNVVTNSVGIQINEVAGVGGGATSTSSTKLSGTNDWTFLTVTVTTLSTTRYINISLNNELAGNVSDAWFDDIKLDLTSNTVRTAVT